MKCGLFFINIRGVVSEMLKRVEQSDVELIKEYIGNEYDKCLYLYLDFIKYGLSNPNLKFWFDIEKSEIKSDKRAHRLHR